MGLEMDFLIPLLTIISIDIVLGGDNAIVVALACRNLPDKIRNKAILLGIGLAIFARISLTLFAVYLLQIPMLMAIGGALLLYIAYHLLVGMDDDRDIQGQTTLFAAIKTIIIADIVMGFDNVIAVAGAAHGNTTLVIIGLLVSVPIIIWGSKLILFAMERFPIIIYIGSAILAFTATKMIIHEPMLAPLFSSHPLISTVLQVSLIIAVVFSGWLIKKFRKDSLEFKM
uniref:Tellurium resistance protein TerC n=2 Tax=Anaerobacillus isosaccharinicus TaxID=1532552 RepID=A0A1S2L7K8_9BACI|nr:TerC family protein [Anaerobacillus isosaccharinicus]MBA5587650.1 TerC family protein [Anaerobacillus isosaccharinicus]QOY34177.1 TerC family protein [Anaerobacillus isosaccharinicus]